MDRHSATLVAAAVVLMALAFLSPTFAPAFFGADDDFEAFVGGICFMVVAFIFAVVLLIVGIVRPSNRQQQQQQVIVMGAGGLPVPPGTTVTTRVRCPTCQHLNPQTARFCTQCATYIGGRT